MKVNVISYSQSPDGDSSLTDLVAYCARVSNPSNQMNKENNDRLLKYLMKNKHWSPFEMVSVCLEIETTRDIARQILRHRSFSFQEFSQRYANPAEMGSQVVMREARLQDTKNRQNSIEVEGNDDIQHDWLMHQVDVSVAAQNAYKWAIDNGIAKEQARAVLPEGNTKSCLYMNGTLRSWLHYIDLRCANGTQKEHMEVAEECKKLIIGLVPEIFNLKESK